MAQSNDEILREKFAQQAQGLAQSLRQRLINDPKFAQENKNTLDFVNRVTNVNKQLNLLSPTVLQNHPDVKNNKLWQMAKTYFNLVAHPQQQQAQSEQHKEVDMLEYFAAKILAKKSPKAKPGKSGEDPELGEHNPDGEDLKTDLSDEQIAKVLENDPHVPDNLGGLGPAFLAELQGLEKDAMSLTKVSENPVLGLAAKLSGQMGQASLYAPMKPSPDNTASQEDPAQKKNSPMRPRPPTPFDIVKK